MEKKNLCSSLRPGQQYWVLQVYAFKRLRLKVPVQKTIQIVSSDVVKFADGSSCFLGDCHKTQISLLQEHAV